MKKIYLILTLTVLFTTVISFQGECKNFESLSDDWTGSIRIEGKTETIWNGVVTVSDTHILAKNLDTDELEEFYIPYPSVLGAFYEASVIGEFSYEIEYWPSFDGFLVKSIEGNSEWWHYWIDYKLPMVGIGDFKLNESHNEILLGYLENWDASALKIYVDKSSVNKNEEFAVSVFDEKDSSVENATVYASSKTYYTNSDGNASIKISNKGNYKIYAEKDDFVRSEKINVQVKKKSLIKNLEIFRLSILFEHILKIVRNLKLQI